ncbi:hypothetical protein M3Y98_00628600 [Aphelenchoides besseyi]|nr:hypothetical protein M3Y98_00628600 [Aphelenchoides besseyi]KAI6208453.1 hypothetical protein M3Y96_00116900 [Aphelenchoides besseyi]
MDNIHSLVTACERKTTAAGYPHSSVKIKSKDRIYARRLTLAKAVQKRKHILFGNNSSYSCDKDSTDDQTKLNELRGHAWESVRQELIAHGFKEFELKTRMDVQKTDWQHVRRLVMDKRKKYPHLKDEPSTELDDVVYDIVNSVGRGYYSKDNSEHTTELDIDVLQDLPQTANFINASLSALSPSGDELELSASENGHLPQLSQLLGLSNDYQSHNSTSFEANDLNAEILKNRVQREKQLLIQEKIRTEIEQQRLLQERIRSKLLLMKLTKESPEMATEFAHQLKDSNLQ